MKAKIAILVLLSSAPWVSAESTVPKLMSYQGRVTDSAGTAIGSTTAVNRAVTFRLYSVSSGGTATYNETQTVTISGGEFSVLIGNGTGLTGLPGPTSPASPLKTLDTVINTATTSALYLGITVDDGNSATADAEISPRQQLVTGVYAMRALMAETVASGAVTTTMLGDGSVNTNQLAANSINSAKIADASIATADIAGNAITAAKLDTTTIGLWTPSGNNIYRNSSVGIGVTSPEAVLQVAAKTGSTTPANNGLRVYNATASAGNNAVLAAAVAGASSGSPFVSFDISGVQGWSIGADNADLDKLVFKNSWDFTANPKMAIDVAGNVGIGTTSPTEKLMVSGGNARIYNASAPYLAVASDFNTAFLAVATSAGNYSASAAAKDFVVRSDSAKLILQSGSGPAGIVIDTANKVGIGTAVPVGKLSIAESSGTVATANSGSLVLDHDNVGGASSILFRSKNNQGSDFAYIQYQDDANIGGTAETSRLVIGTQNDADDHIILAPSGRVGIGTMSPVVQLDVRGTTARTQTDFKNGTSDSGDYSNKDLDSNNGTPSAGLNVTIRAEGYVESLGAVYYSDKRIKNIVSRVDPASALERINQLQVTDYRMVDTAAYGGSVRTGLIAQEVQSVMPEVLSVRNDFVPDVYAYASGLNYSQSNQLLYVTMTKAHGFGVGDKVRVFDDQGCKELVVREVNGTNGFSVTAESKPGKLLVYGKLVNDFLAVDYDRVFTTGISAIQELSKELDAKDATISALEARLSTLEKLISGTK